LNTLIGWLIVIAVAVAIVLRTIKTYKDKAETEQLRAGLKARAEEYRKEMNVKVFQDQYFSLVAGDKEETEEETVAAQAKALTAKQIGHALSLVAVTLEAVVKQPTKAKMIEVMEHYILEFGQRSAQTAEPLFEDDFLVRALNGILVEIKQHDQTKHR
jgi:hypothetical protein